MMRGTESGTKGQGLGARRCPILGVILAAWFAGQGMTYAVAAKHSVAAAPRKVYPAVRASEPIAVDGDAADWQGVPSLYLDPFPAVHWGDAGFAGADDLSARAQLCWSEDSLYLAVHVQDEAVLSPFEKEWDLWQNDGVELFLDFDLEADAEVEALGADDAQVVFCPAEGVPRVSCPSPCKLTAKVEIHRTPGGYFLEAKLNIPETFRNDWQAGRTVGLNVAVNDMDSEDGGWESQIRWFRWGRPSADARARHRMRLVENALDAEGADVLAGRVSAHPIRDTFPADGPIRIAVRSDVLPGDCVLDLTLLRGDGTRHDVGRSLPLSGPREIACEPFRETPQWGEDFLVLSTVRLGDRKLHETMRLVMTEGSETAGVPPLKRGELYGDESREKRITDLTAARPSSALSDRREIGKWKVISYAFKDFEGKMLSALAETKAPGIEIPLGVEGWHAVYIGYRAPRYLPRTRLSLRLDSSGHYVDGVPPIPGPYGRLLDTGEIFWKYANIGEGENLGVRQVSHGMAAPCDITFVRLVPLRPWEAATAEGMRKDRDHRRLVAFNDGFSAIYARRPETAEEIESWVEPLRFSDVKRLCWELGSPAGMMSPSRHAPLFGAQSQSYPRQGDRYAAEAAQILAAKGINPLKIACDYAHGMDLEFYVSMRMGAWCSEPPYEELFRAPFYWDNPQWRCRAEDGREVPRMSYAFREVQDFIVGMFREAYELGADGIHLLYIRGQPYVLHEAPVVERFRKEHGEVTAETDDDPRWRACRADIMTDFMRHLREETRSWPDAPGGGSPRISVHVFGSEKENLDLALDVRAWVREGCVDTVVAYDRPTTMDSIDVAFFEEACAKDGVEWICEASPTDGKKLREKRAMFFAQALRAYEAGAHGLAFWDTNQYDVNWPLWRFMCRMGHLDELRDPPPLDPGTRGLPAIRMDGIPLDLWSPDTAY
ncbi:sugar-binding protein [Verrucomicrobiota bacterium]